MVTKFDYNVWYSAIFAPKKAGTSVSIGNETISLSMIDCLDVDLTNGDVIVRNKLMGNNVIMSTKGVLLKFNRQQLVRFINTYKDRFVKIKE